MASRELPHNFEAEAALLGSVLIDPRTLNDVLPIVAPSDFYDAKHKAIFSAMATMKNNREAIDIVTLDSRIERGGKAKLTGGPAYLAELLGAVPSAVNARHYAEIVTETATQRGLLDAANTVAKLAYDDALDKGERQGLAESAVFAVRRSQSGDVIRLAEVANEVWSEYERIQSGEIPPAIRTGYKDIDRYLTGWRRQELTTIAARPGIGKTALLLGMALKAAKAGYGVLVFSAEMARKSCVERMVRMAGVTNLPGGRHTVDWSGIADSLGQMSKLPLWIDDTPNIRIDDLRAKAMRLASEERIDIIFADYVQLLRGSRRRDSRYLEIGDITKASKQLARELDCHYTMAAQLSRQAEGVRPTLAMLKESGAIEEDSDNVIFLHRGREIAEGERVVETEIIIGKQRQGPTATVSLGWMPERMAFVPLVNEKEPRR